MKAATRGNWHIIGYKRSKRNRFLFDAVCKNDDNGDVKLESEMIRDGDIYYYVELGKFKRGIVNV